MNLKKGVSKKSLWDLLFIRCCTITLKRASLKSWEEL